MTVSCKQLTRGANATFSRCSAREFRSMKVCLVEGNVFRGAIISSFPCSQRVKLWAEGLNFSGKLSFVIRIIFAPTASASFFIRFSASEIKGDTKTPPLDA